MNIAARTVHIAAAGTLLGGHVFGIAPERLVPWLYWTVITGAALIAIEAYPSWRWCLEGRAAMVILKAVLVALVPWLWPYRVFLLMAVVVLGSVGSHMPRRFRHRLWTSPPGRTLP